MITILDWNNLDEAQRQSALTRAIGSGDDVIERMKIIVQAVREKGNEAVAAYAKQFDSYSGPLEPISQADIQKAIDSLPKTTRKAMDIAIDNLARFHEAQRPSPVTIETMRGVKCELQWRPIEKVGLYVPGGVAPLFSAVFMLALPAKIAGCSTRVLCTPPQKDGRINSETLAAAGLCGATEVYAFGGPWSIAAMAYGTETVSKVDKILGPGNSYVTATKMIISQDPRGAAIDGPAGPSEVMVIADDGANPAWVAADLLAQAEHGRDSQAMLVTPSRKLGEQVNAELQRQRASLPRNDFIKSSLSISSILIVKDLDQACEIVSRYAPEHLILQGGPTATWPTELVPRITQAGAIFVGDYSPETAGDYASGANHVLPTYGLARAYSGLNLLSFMRSMSVQTLSQEGLLALAPALIAMAEAEELDAHAQAVKIRI
ncbi:MAG: histidinol dehydrogenase [Alphaproteobacteria bacterium]|jgi:histidinol dehydrogenase|nr:histidinol dehydrogenase [Alphaproteobacteria bacterium]